MPSHDNRLHHPYIPQHGYFYVYQHSIYHCYNERNYNVAGDVYLAVHTNDAIRRYVFERCKVDVVLNYLSRYANIRQANV
jgi:hypothetical protein